jgi:hypothetical protein
MADEDLRAGTTASLQQQGRCSSKVRAAPLAEAHELTGIHQASIAR